MCARAATYVYYTATVNWLSTLTCPHPNPNPNPTLTCPRFHRRATLTRRATPGPTNAIPWVRVRVGVRVIQTGFDKRNTYRQVVGLEGCRVGGLGIG